MVRSVFKGSWDSLDALSRVRTTITVRDVEGVIDTDAERARRAELVDALQRAARFTDTVDEPARTVHLRVGEAYLIQAELMQYEKTVSCVTLRDRLGQTIVVISSNRGGLQAYMDRRAITRGLQNRNADCTCATVLNKEEMDAAIVRAEERGYCFHVVMSVTGGITAREVEKTYALLGAELPMELVERLKKSER